MRITEPVLALTALGLVLAFGGVLPLTIGVMEFAVAALAVIVFWNTGLPPVKGRILIPLGVLLVVPLLQLVPLPHGLTGLLSPARVRLYDLTSAYWPSASGLVPLSVIPRVTIAAYLKLLAYVLVFLLAFQSYCRYRRSILGVCVVVIGLFEAIYGLVQYLTGWQYIFTYAKKINLGMATGTYINPHHYAGLLELCLPFLVASVCCPIAARSGRARWLSHPENSLIGFRLLLFAVVSIGLVFSTSRGGIIVAAVSSLLVGTACLAGTSRKSLAIAVLLALLIVPTAYASWIGLAPVVHRFSITNLEKDRLGIWRDTAVLIGDYPLFGTGLGTYPWTSLQYQTRTLDLRFEHAHNDYLETAADLGIPWALVVFAALWLLAVKLLRASMQPRGTQTRIQLAGCGGALLATLLHSLGDFNLQIPANAFLFAWLAGLGAALLVTGRTFPEDGGRSSALRRHG